MPITRSVYFGSFEYIELPPSIRKYSKSIFEFGNPFANSFNVPIENIKTYDSEQFYYEETNFDQEQ